LCSDVSAFAAVISGSVDSALIAPALLARRKRWFDFRADALDHRNNIASATPAAIRPYSMAVAAFSSFKK
jgi:hypothetical protein